MKKQSKAQKKLESADRELRFKLQRVETAVKNITDKTANVYDLYTFFTHSHQNDNYFTTFSRRERDERIISLQSEIKSLKLPFRTIGKDLLDGKRKTMIYKIEFVANSEVKEQEENSKFTEIAQNFEITRIQKEAQLERIEKKIKEKNVNVDELTLYLNAENNTDNYLSCSISAASGRVKAIQNQLNKLGFSKHFDVSADTSDTTGLAKINITQLQPQSIVEQNTEPTKPRKKGYRITALPTDAGLTDEERLKIERNIQRRISAQRPEAIAKRKLVDEKYWANKKALLSDEVIELIKDTDLDQKHKIFELSKLTADEQLEKVHEYLNKQKNKQKKSSLPPDSQKKSPLEKEFAKIKNGILRGCWDGNKTKTTEIVKQNNKIINNINTESMNTTESNQLLSPKEYMEAIQKLTVLEQGDLLVQQKDIFENLHPETKHSSKDECFVTILARELNVHNSTLYNRINISKNISPEVKGMIKNAEIANKTQTLLQLSKLSAETQVKKVNEIININTEKMNTTVIKKTRQNTTWTPEFKKIYSKLYNRNISHNSNLSVDELKMQTIAEMNKKESVTAPEPALFAEIKKNNILQNTAETVLPEINKTPNPDKEIKEIKKHSTVLDENKKQYNAAKPKKEELNTNMPQLQLSEQLDKVQGLIPLLRRDTNGVLIECEFNVAIKKCIDIAIQ